MKMYLKRTLLIWFVILFSGFSSADDTLSEEYQVGNFASATSLSAKITRAIFGQNAYTQTGALSNDNLAKYFLSNIFGGVSHAFGTPQAHGPGGLVALLFMIFNMGILGITSLLVIYSSVFSVSTIAHDGGMVGSGRFSPFSFARVVCSIIALVPSFSGYSLIQVVVMKMVVAGVVVADIAWDATIDYINIFGNEMFRSVEVASTNVAPNYGAKLLVDVDSDIEERAESPALATSSTMPVNYISYSLGDPNGQMDRSIQKYLNPINVALLDSIYILRKCAPVMDGYMGYSVTPYFTVTKTPVENSPNPQQDTLRVDMLMRGGPGQMVSVHCFDIILNYPVSATSLPDSQILQNNTQFVNALRIYIQGCGNRLASIHRVTTTSLYESTELRDVFASELNTFYNAIKNTSVQNMLSVDSEDSVTLFNTAYKSQGWASAGLHFMDLVKYQSSETESIDRRYNAILANNQSELRNYAFSFNNVNLKPMVLNTEKYQGDESTPLFREMVKNRYISQYVGQLPPLVNVGLTTWAYSKTSNIRQMLEERIAPVNASKFSMGPITFDANVVGDEIRSMSSGVANAVLDAMSTEITTSDRSLLSSHPNPYSALRENPILVTQRLGMDMIKYSRIYFTQSTKKLYEEITLAQHYSYALAASLSSVRGFAKGVVAANKLKKRNKSLTERDKANAARSIFASKSAGIIADPIQAVIEFSQAASKAIVSIYLPYGNGLAAVYFVAGVILGAYIPFAPTLIFIFSILAWIFAVIEAMVAAPIVIIGFAHPEGHEMIGKTEQAIMLLVGVLVRPFVTLVGFLLAMMLSVSLIKLFNSIILVSTVFYFRNLSQVDINHPVPIMFGVSGLVVLYAYSLMVVLQQCYSMIYLIPDQILKWVGGPAQSAGAGIASVMRSVSTGLTQQSQSAVQGGSQASRGATSISTRQ